MPIPPECVAPPNGFVPNAETAAEIAEAIWLPIYGEAIKDERPYKVSLVSDRIWLVRGILESGRDGEIVLGGVAEAWIARADGRVIHVTHGK
jgi:hypothetical protein